MNNSKCSQKITKYSRYFSNEKFKKKVIKVARIAGIKVIYASFLLYYSLMDDNFPAKERILILGALGYFILPVDLIPDAVPFVGFTDDFIALLFALKKVYTHITPEISEKAKAKVIAIFGNVDEKEFNLI